LRREEKAVAFVKDFVASGKPVAAICHAPWTLVEADAVRGRTLTAWPSRRDRAQPAAAAPQQRDHTGLVAVRCGAQLRTSWCQPLACGQRRAEPYEPPGGRLVEFGDGFS
jgi:putative intracellular protease/amidase